MAQSCSQTSIKRLKSTLLFDDMLRTLGADAVGMSTVVEAIVANHMGMKICGISCVCNPAAGMNEQPLTHEEVQEASAKAAPLFEQLVTESIAAF